LNDEAGPRVVALSSGFMTYPDDTHPEYPRLRREVAHSVTTFVLIPSLDRESCVAETVRRQLDRPFARSREKEEAVIRERFPLYAGLPARKIETMRPLPVIVGEIVTSIRDNLPWVQENDADGDHTSGFTGVRQGTC
jgi:shikimate kinase